MSNAADLDPGRFTAMTRLDHNRAKSQLAARLGVSVNDITKMTIWGNHSTTQYPDLFHCEVNGKNAYELVGDHDWYDSTYIPTVAKRGAAIIEARGASSAASAASAAVDHVRDWVLGTPEGDWVSMSIPSDGSYGVPEGIISSFPCVCKDGDVRDRAGARHRRLQPRQDRRDGGRTGQRARRRRRTRPDLTHPRISRPNQSPGSSSMATSFVVVAQLRIVIRWYSGVPTILLILL